MPSSALCACRPLLRATVPVDRDGCNLSGGASGDREVRMSAFERMDVVVLAGGAGRRMGGDKALVRDATGRRLVDVVLARLAPLGGRVVLARGDHDPVPGTGPDVAQVPDAPGAPGPVGGIVAGLAATSSAWVAVVAVDLLAVDPGVLWSAARLGARGETDRVVVPLDDTGRPQWLHAAWPRSVAPRARQLLAEGAPGGGRVGAFVDALGWSPLSPDGPTHWAHNANRPQDLLARTSEDVPTSAPGAGDRPGPDVTAPRK